MDNNKLGEIKDIIRKLDSFEICCLDVPKEYEKNKKILSFERKKGIREDLERGYDIIANQFVVVEKLYYKTSDDEMAYKTRTEYFDSFEDYYDFLDGNIYDNSCYKFCDFSKYNSFIRRRKIDVEKLNLRENLISNTIDDVNFDYTKKELELFDEAERRKKELKKWIREINKCSSGEEIRIVLNKYRESKVYSHDEFFLLFNYVFYDIKDKSRFKALMEYVSKGNYRERQLTKSLCFVYDPDEVLEKCEYSLGTKQTIDNHKKEVESFIEELKQEKINLEKRCFFDKKYHFYCEEIKGSYKSEKYLDLKIQRYFDTFEELAEYRNNDLRGGDFSDDFHLNVDFSKYIIDENTRIPLKSIHNSSYSVIKEYREKNYIVTKRLHGDTGKCIRINMFKTPFWFDFVYYLKGDISYSDFTHCENFENLPDLNGLKIDGIKLRGVACEKFGIPYEKYIINDNSLVTFPLTESNEEKSLPLLKEIELKGLLTKTHDSLNLEENDRFGFHTYRVSYITDLHLDFRLKNANCLSKEDVLIVLNKIVSTLKCESSRILLIGGDVTSSLELFEMFVSLLEERIKNTPKKIIFVLGNHELWGFSDKTIDYIVEKYREIVTRSGMFLVQNSLICFDANDNLFEIKYQDLINKDEKELKDLTRSTRLNIFGGIGFSKYNMIFNANNGIYRDTLDRNEEIKESEKFEEIYKKIVSILKNKNTVILTHFPRVDWDGEKEPCENFIYVSGHTHRNEFYDDGVYREYYDNQIGYYKENVHLKAFLVDDQYDCFSDYEDGVYNISREQYIDFYRGKNLRISFDRRINRLYMLKKHGYYCFLHESFSSLSILNGGAFRRLDYKNINYYYENMDKVISSIKNPLKKYTEYQRKIANAIKKIDGKGRIHGCIIDIDFFNHIYVNPLNMKITAYWAGDMINKMVYPDILSLLKEQCPLLYANYEKSIDSSKKELVVANKKTRVIPIEYLNTDIYAASKEINKMQKLNNNILSIWVEPTNIKSIPMK